MTGGYSLLLGLIILALLVLAGVLLAVGSRRQARVIGDVDTEDGLINSFSGGLRWPLPAGMGATNVPPTLVGLELYPWGLRISARWAWLRAFVPTWYVRYEELIAAEHSSRHKLVSRRASQGVRLRALVNGAPMIFWTSNWSFLLDALEERGVNVSRSTSAVRFWSNL